MNLFDGPASRAFDLTLTVMGYECTWAPSNGAAVQNCRVHLRQMSDKEVLADIEQYPTCEVVEFKSADLVGLKEAVDSRKTEQITVNNTAYWVQAVRFKFDGNTLCAYVTKA